ncbi:hypothetical protein PGQ11_005966 [Apiospora arundinis]|uniref:Uncharacterized protein n=1 Tax=Apiospora arundinis TaxID=335852 RepID=A0ABR2IR62_9PEZI
MSLSDGGDRCLPIAIRLMHDGTDLVDRLSESQVQQRGALGCWMVPEGLQVKGGQGGLRLARTGLARAGLAWGPD